MTGRPWFLAVAVLALGGWEPLWRSDPDVEAGNKAYAEQRYDDALAAYERAADEGVDGAGLAYDRGTAMVGKAAALPEGLERDAAYAQAMKELARAAATPDLKLRARAHYNRGNVLMKQKKLEEAIAAYKDSLRADVKLDVARMNLELALRQREREERQRQQQGQGQGQQGQGGGQQGQQGQQGQGQGQGQQGQGQSQGGDGGQQPQQGGGDQQQQGQGGGSDQQQQGQGGGGDQPQQGQGSGSGQQGQGSGSGQQGQGSGSGSQDDPTQAQGGGGGGGGAPASIGPTTPRSQPTEDDDGQTPDTPMEGKLDELERESREQRREQVRRRSGDVQLDYGEDW